MPSRRQCCYSRGDSRLWVEQLQASCNKFVQNVSMRYQQWRGGATHCVHIVLHGSFSLYYSDNYTAGTVTMSKPMCLIRISYTSKTIQK